MFTKKLLSGFFISIFFCAGAHPVFPAGLSGRLGGVVLEAVSGLPIEKAKVELNGGEFVCLTNVSGRFDFPQVPVGDWVASVSRMGYKSEGGIPVRVAGDDPPDIRLELQPQAIILPGQRVTGTRLDYDLFVPPAVILSGDEMRKAGFRDLPQALASLPGIVVNTGYSTSGTPEVTIRGERGKRLGITLDGLSLAEGIRGEIDLATIPLAAVENIEVRRGGQWGDAALGGSVNINTRKNFATDKTVSVGYGSFDEWNIFSTISGLAGSDLGYLISGETSDRRDTYTYVDALGHETTRANTGAQLKKIYAKLGGRLAPNWDWGVSGLLQENDRGMPGTIQFSFPAAQTKEQRRILTADLGGVWGNRLSVSIRSSMSDFRSFYRDTLTFPSHSQYDEAAYLIDAALLFSPYKNSSVTASAGSELRNRKLAGNDYMAADPAFDEATRTAKAVWGQVQLRPPFSLPAWTGSGSVTGGFRYDRDGQTPSHGAPRFGVAWGWGTPRFVNLNAGWGRSFRRPLLTSLFWEDAFSHGNPQLEPEKSREWDIKIEVIPPKTNLAASTRFFDRASDGFIEWAPDASFAYSPVNLPRAVLVGREDGLSWMGFDRRFSIDFLHTLIWATNEAPSEYQGKFLLNRPKHSYQVKTRLLYRGLDARLSARWEDKRYLDKQNTRWLAPYRWFDFSVRQTVPWNFMNPIVTLRCENLTNESAAIHEGYPLPSRTFAAGIELHF